MKKLIMAAIAVVSLCLSNVTAAADVVITTGQQGLTYNAVYGVNLASALSEYTAGCRGNVCDSDDYESDLRDKNGNPYELRNYLTIFRKEAIS
ncbi:hypothetical protein ACUM6X_000446 [Klebsiella aerogenes]